MRLDLDFQVDITQVPAGPLSLASIEWAGAQPPITQAGCPPLEEILYALPCDLLVKYNPQYWSLDTVYNVDFVLHIASL